MFVGLLLRSLKAELQKFKVENEKMKEESRKKDIKIIELLMQNREFKKVIEKYENRDAIMEAVGLIPPKKKCLSLSCLLNIDNDP